MANHYFLRIVLPELRFGEVSPLSFDEFKILLKDNLNSSEMQHIQTVLTYFDIENLRLHWKKESLNSYGSLDDFILPQYVHDYFEAHETLEDRLKYFPDLIATYYRKGASLGGWIGQYLEFERKCRLIQVAFRSRQLSRDLATELQFENPEEPFIYQLLSQKNAESFEPPEGFEPLKELYEKHYTAPLELYKALNKYRFQKLEEFVKAEEFSFDRILSYMVQLIIIEQTHSVIIREEKYETSNS